MTEKGARVVAIRDGKGTTLNVYGYGTYVGDLPRPRTPEAVESSLAQCAAYIENEDRVSLDANPVLRLFDATASRLSAEEASRARAELVASIKYDRTLPIEERAKKLDEEAASNPCIHLDNGRIVWGFQCWWGPAEDTERRFPSSKFTWVEVPVPDTNGSWK